MNNNMTSEDLKRYLLLLVTEFNFYEDIEEKLKFVEYLRQLQDKYNTFGNLDNEYLLNKYNLSEDIFKLIKFITFKKYDIMDFLRLSFKDQIIKDFNLIRR